MSASESKHSTAAKVRHRTVIPRCLKTGFLNAMGCISLDHTDLLTIPAVGKRPSFKRLEEWCVSRSDQVFDEALGHLDRQSQALYNELVSQCRQQTMQFRQVLSDVLVGAFEPKIACPNLKSNTLPSAHTLVVDAKAMTSLQGSIRSSEHIQMTILAIDFWTREYREEQRKHKIEAVCIVEGMQMRALQDLRDSARTMQKHNKMTRYFSKALQSLGSSAATSLPHPGFS